jgi:hypothetical protein
LLWDLGVSRGDIPILFIEVLSRVAKVGRTRWFRSRSWKL